MSAATFACPHCGQQYPVKPVLVGKVVRCTACKNPFRLRPDGIADKIEAAPAPAAAAPAPAAPAPRPAPAPVPAPRPPAPAPKPTAPAAPAPVQKPLSPPTPKAGMTRQQEDARKAMAESLRASMGEALKAEEGATEAAPGDTSAQRPGAKSDRKRPSGLFKPPKDPKKAGKGPAVLTGEGEREAEIQRKWWIGFAAAAVAIVLLVFLVTRSGERTTAVRAFTAELPAKDNRYGARLPAIQARAWQPGVTAFLDLPSPSFGSVHEIPGGSIDQGLAPIKGLAWLPEAKRWVAPDKADWLKRQLAEDARTLSTRLERAGVPTVDPEAVRKSLVAAGLGEGDADLLLPVLQGGPLAAKFAGGSAPTVEWCSIQGRGGTYLHDPGQQYRISPGDYHGVLARFQGEGWPSEWRFLLLEPVAKN